MAVYRAMFFFYVCAAANVLHGATKVSSCFLGVRRALRRGDRVWGSTDARVRTFFYNSVKAPVKMLN